MKTTQVKTTMIAPCGMNCSICRLQFRSPKECDGCNSGSRNLPLYCFNCIMRNCTLRVKGNGRYCFQCDTFPCARLKRLDKRYRNKYGMSMLENLRNIKEMGIRKFVSNEKKRWACSKCGKLLCVHGKECGFCGAKRKVKNF